MSSAEPFMPAHWPSDRDRAHAEIDLDADVDIIPASAEGADDDEGTLDDVEFSDKGSFHSPTPGDALTGDELAADLEAAADNDEDDAEG